MAFIPLMKPSSLQRTPSDAAIGGIGNDFRSMRIFCRRIDSREKLTSTSFELYLCLLNYLAIIKSI
jgi:hypothetical protein